MKPIIIKSIGQWLKFKGYKVGEVEEQLGLSTGFFSRLTDYKTIPFELAYKLSKLLNVSLDSLYDLLCAEEIKQDERKRSI